MKRCKCGAKLKNNLYGDRCEDCYAEGQGRGLNVVSEVIKRERQKQKRQEQKEKENGR